MRRSYCLCIFFSRMPTHSTCTPHIVQIMNTCLLFMCVSAITLEKRTALDRGSKSGRPRYHPCSPRHNLWPWPIQPWLILDGYLPAKDKVESNWCKNYSVNQGTDRRTDTTDRNTTPANVVGRNVGDIAKSDILSVHILLLQKHWSKLVNSIGRRNSWLKMQL